jgi:OmpA-OmpF porin, OOP family
MKSAAILAAGIVAFALLAFLCLPRHASQPIASTVPIPANFHARVEYGMLILRGSLPNEASKATILQQAQELYGTTPGNVVDELAVDPRVGTVAWADNVAQILPVLGQMKERGSIIIDGRTIVVSGQVGSARDKATVLQTIAPLTQSGLELEDRILAGPIMAGRSTKAPSPTAPSQKTPATNAPVLVAARSPKAPAPAVLSQKVSVTTPPSLVLAQIPKAPSLPITPSPAAPSLTVASPASLQKKLNEILTRSSIEFESKSTTITPSSLATLDQLIAQLRQFPPIPIEIGGHTDKYGEPEYNLELSQHRADTVRRYFTKHGLPKQFTAVGYGDSRPLTVRGNRTALQHNRRIELQVKGHPQL